MEIEYKLKNLRVKVRQNSKKIMDDVLERNVPKKSLKNKPKTEICVFCSSANNITKEHVLPKWIFQKRTEDFFITDTNESEQTYNKTTIPACADCNNNLLANIENYIIGILKNTDVKTSPFSNQEIENIIRWLEIIEYKFQILEIRRKFTKMKSADYNSYLADIPISIMRKNIDYSPNKAVAQVRIAQKRITTKSKELNVNSLLILSTKNKNFHFFHTMNDFIFLELPEYKIALFYFYSKIFENVETAQKEAIEIVNKVY
jgi:hypothetical protein